MTQLSNLVGTPIDKIAYDLFTMVNHNRESVLDLDTIIPKSFAPWLVDLEASRTATKTYKSSTGGMLKAWLSDLESQMKALEATTVPDALKELVLQVHKSIKTEIFPAIFALWQLYKLATDGQVETCTLGADADTGKALFEQLRKLGCSIGSVGTAWDVGLIGWPISIRRGGLL
jgi:hypothetical protein